MKLPKTRASARKLGRATYFTGRACPRGHIAPRLTSSCYCLACNNEDGRRWNRKNPDTRRSYAHKFHAIPAPTRPMPERCECCNRKASGKRLAVDHDHETGEFRGWLCNACNTGLGLLGDKKENLESAVKYLLAAHDGTQH